MCKMCTMVVDFLQEMQRRVVETSSRCAILCKYYHMMIVQSDYLLICLEHYQPSMTYDVRCHSLLTAFTTKHCSVPIGVTPPLG